DELAGSAAGQPAALLFVGAERMNVGDDHVRVERHGEAALVDAGQLLDDDHRLEKVAAGAAVCFFEPRAQEPRLTCLAPGVAVHDPRLHPSLLVRDHFSLEKRAEASPEQLVLFSKQVSLHRPNICANSPPLAMLKAPCGGGSSGVR